MKLRLMNDPVLREITQPVVAEDIPTILESLSEMIKIMKNVNGLALAANQVGISKRFFIMPIEEKIKIFINPEIIEISDKTPFEEGCLSIPGASAQTMRARYIKFKFYDENMTSHEMELSGVQAVAVQHEIDHLDGKLYIDQLQPMKRLLVVNKHRKFLNSMLRRK
jgi:peptide deformylase